MNQTITHQTLGERWSGVSEPDWHVNQEIFKQFHEHAGYRRAVLNCAIPLPRAKALTDFEFPAGWDLDKCLAASAGREKRPPGLEEWEYQPKVRAVPQLPYFKPLPEGYESLNRSPWFQSPSQAPGLGINARHLRYHCQLWNDLKPKTLRGVLTTLVYVTPQLGLSLTPHINLDKAFFFQASLARCAGPAQLFPASYLYPDSQLNGLEKAPAPIFADVLPFLGAPLPVLDVTPDPWGTLCHFDGPDYFYSYPFHRTENSVEDVTLYNHLRGAMVLPDGTPVNARTSESHVYATLDPKLKAALKLGRSAFQRTYGLNRGVITHDGLPFHLPVEMQAAVFALVLTAWELEMDRATDLTSYVLRTQHAAIRSYHFYQQVEPYYSNFMRLVHQLAKVPDFVVYPLANHLNHSWLGGNLRLANQISESERHLGARFMRSYYQQQLDWMMGVINLWNHIEFRNRSELERQLDTAGVAFHQMRPQLQFDSHLFPRPLRRTSFWPALLPAWLDFDQTGNASELPRPIPES